MWKTAAALVLLVAPALAQERLTAYDALRVVGAHINRDAVNHVISVTGVKGNPQPETWKVLLDDRAHGGIREISVRNGQIASERPSSMVGSAEGATINTSRLNLDSSGAFQVASHIADKSGTRFDSASYTLRTDQHGDPVWIMTLHGVNGRPVGTIYIGANRGNVTRTEGMFAGASMNDVATEERVYREQPTKTATSTDRSTACDNACMIIFTVPRMRRAQCLSGCGVRLPTSSIVSDARSSS